MALYKGSDGVYYASANGPQSPGDQQVNNDPNATRDQANQLNEKAGNGAPHQQTAGEATAAQAATGSPTSDQAIANQDAQSTADAKAAADAKAQAELAAYQAKTLNNKYNYGGFEGGANEATNYYQSVGAGALQRQGAQINYGNANGNRQNALNDREVQLSMAGLMRARAEGKTPSIAGMVGARDMNRVAAEQSSAAASARGPAALALAQQGAAANTANAQSTISNATQINSANERLQAEQAALAGYSGIRSGDYQGQGIDAQQAQAQAAIDQQQKAQNDAFFNANADRSVGINNSQLNAQMHQVDTATGAQQAEAQRAQQAGFHSDDRTDKYIGYGAGAAGAVGGALLLSALGGGAGNGGPPKNSTDELEGHDPNAKPGGFVDTTDAGQNGDPDPYGGVGREEGGPIRAGKPYVVGERGPEMVVPAADGHVLTAEQTRAVQEAASKAAADVAATAAVARPTSTADRVTQSLVDVSHAPPVPGATPGLMDPAKAIQGAGQAASMSAEGYERLKPSVIAARMRTEQAIDEATARARNVARALAGQRMQGDEPKSQASLMARRMRMGQ